MNRIFQVVHRHKKTIFTSVLIFSGSFVYSQNAELDSMFRVFNKHTSYTVKLVTPDTIAVLAKRDLPVLPRTFVFLRAKDWVGSGAAMEIRVYIDSMIINEPDVNIVRERKIDHLDRPYKSGESDHFKATFNYRYRLSFLFVVADTVARHFNLPWSIEGTTTLNAGMVAHYGTQLYYYSRPDDATKSGAEEKVKNFKSMFNRNIPILAEDVNDALTKLRKQLRRD